MRNILDLLWQIRFTLLFVTFEAIALYFIIRHNGYQQSIILSASSSFTGRVQERYDRVLDYFSLRQANEALVRENALLRASLKESFVLSSKKVFYREDTVYRQRFEYVPARVIRSTFNRRSNYLVIDKGEDDGIHKDMGVITSQGVVGIVHSASKHYASVLSMLHKDVRLSGRIKRSGYVGTVRWEGGSAEEAALTEVPGHVVLRAGDTVITSGYSLIFPAGQPIGVVKRHFMREGDHFHTITLELLTPFRGVDHVYVIRDLAREELDQLKLPQDE
ncbi:MAG TPA: rod shape-determining protein MreC [Bacteroidales bacterium]|nr:rod shape-determining protein MreC [Bacteroidales bacterium]HRZ77208.1 rod shape-determining protein MreC [Bacteroidales bacterium]